MKISKLYTAICAVALSAASLTSCTDYLDKSPDSDISATDAYKDFQNFQGFTEELYNCIPYFSKGYWTNSWNWGEDEIMNVGIDYHMVYKVDQGDFWFLPYVLAPTDVLSQFIGSNSAASFISLAAKSAVS